MPAKSNDLSILEKIYLGNFNKDDYSELTNENIYKIILDDLFFECTGDHKYHRANNTITKCHGGEAIKPTLIVNELRNSLDKNQLINLFDVLNQLKAEISVVSEQLIKQSLSLVAYYSGMFRAKINDDSSSFSENDLLTISSIAKFFTSLFQISNITEYNTFQVGYVDDPNSRYNFTLSHSVNIHKFLNDFLQSSKILFAIFEKYKYLAPEKSIIEFFKTFGDLGFQLKIKDEYQYQADLVMHNAENIISKLWNTSDAFKKSTALTFLNRYHEIKDIDAIKQDCKDVFGLNPQDCRPFTPSSISNITKTLIPETTNTTTTLATVQTVTNITPIINQTISVEDAIIQNNTYPKWSNHTFSNQTDSISHTSALENTHFTFINKMLTSIGLGAFSGFLNGGSQIILHIAEQKNCSLPTQRLLAVTLALANSLAISTFPLVYSIVENLSNDEPDSLVNSEKLLTCTYAFITSIVLQGINAGMHYALPKKALLKNLLSMLPLFAGLWMLANSEESILEYISVLAANIISALATSSSLTYFGLKQFPVNRSNYPVERTNENKSFEMEQLNKEKEHNNGNPINDLEKNLSPEEIFFKKNKFISLENLDKIAKYLKEIIGDTQDFSDMQILQPSKELLQTRLTALKNLYEGLISKDFIKLSKNKTPENVEIQFKSNCESLKFLIESISKELQTNHVFNEDKNLKADLNKIEGLNSKDHTFEFKSKLGKIKDNIGFIDTLIKGAFSHNEKNVSNNKPHENRRNTICFYSSGSEGETRFSIASSSDESSKSDGYSNAIFNDSRVLETQCLLQTRLNR